MAEGMAIANVGSRAWTRLRSPWWASPVAGGLVGATLVRDRFSANAFAFAVVQIVLVALSVIDLETRRLPNSLTLPTSLIALTLRVPFERSHLASAVIAGIGALFVFALLSLMMGGGMGMGDVKLAGTLGFVLGSAVVPALVVGILSGSLAALGLIILRRADRRSTIAYGPYLALGGAVAILALHPAPLV